MSGAMDLRNYTKPSTYVCLFLATINTLLYRSATDAKQDFTDACENIFVSNTRYRTELEMQYDIYRYGDGKLAPCNDKVIYSSARTIRGETYYISHTSGRWTIASNFCQGEGIIRVTDTVKYPYNVTGVWRVRDENGEWQYGINVQVTCVVPSTAAPPLTKIATTPWTTPLTTTIPPGPPESTTSSTSPTSDIGSSGTSNEVLTLTTVEDIPDESRTSYTEHPVTSSNDTESTALVPSPPGSTGTNNEVVTLTTVEDRSDESRTSYTEHAVTSSTESTALVPSPPVLYVVPLVAGVVLVAIIATVCLVLAKNRRVNKSPRVDDDDVIIQDNALYDMTPTHNPPREDDDDVIIQDNALYDSSPTRNPAKEDDDDVIIQDNMLYDSASTQKTSVVLTSTDVYSAVIKPQLNDYGTELVDNATYAGF